VFSPDSGISLCILNGRCWFIIIFPLYNSCYLSSLAEIFVTALDSTDFVWPCNSWKYGCYLWLGQILYNAHVPGCLVTCAPEPSHNSVIFLLCKNNFYKCSLTLFMITTISARESPGLVKCQAGLKHTQELQREMHTMLLMSSSHFNKCLNSQH